MDGFRHTDFIFQRSGTPLGHRTCRAMIQTKRRSTVACSLQSQGRVFSSTRVTPGFGNCRPACPGLTDYSRTCCHWEMKRDDNKPDARSWRKAYGLALSLFAVEVVLLYLFTLRFS